MKTLIISAIVAASALTGAAQAQVGSGAAAAIAHFNQDIDQVNDRSRLVEGAATTFVSTRSSSLGGVFAHFNRDFDAGNEQRGVVGATVPGQNVIAADIFDRIRAESLEDE